MVFARPGCSQDVVVSMTRRRNKRALTSVGLVVAALLATGCGSSGHHTNGFCDTHRCIENFDAGHGSIIQCRDGMWSHSGGLRGACSYHGGEAGYYSPP